MITQKEIAEKAGVSRATVSRIFTQNTNVSPKTLAKVQNAMRILGLDPISMISENLPSKRRYVLVIASNIAGGFLSRIVKGICNRASELGLFVVLYNSNHNMEQELEYMRFAEAEDYAGIILVTAVEDPMLTELLLKIKIPVILVNRYIRSLDLDVVCIDNYRGGYIATSFLVQNGHRRIAYLPLEQKSSAQQDRFRGYEDAMQDFRLPYTSRDIFYGDATQDSGRIIADRLVEMGMPYTGLFISNCPMAIGLVNRLIGLGYHVPEDLSVVCFDDSPYIDEYGLSLTTVSYDPLSMGQSTIDTLIHRIEDPAMNTAKLILTPKLIVRTSVKDISNAESFMNRKTL